MEAISKGLDHFIQRFIPDAFLFAIILTLIVFTLGVLTTDTSPVEMVNYWGGGFWSLLAFAMQMCLVVMTGSILANTSTVKKGLVLISGFANTPGQAVILVTVVTILAYLINYGFGLVVGALIAVQVFKKVPSADYRVLVAVAYSGLLLWHGGLSGSIPLLLATPGHFLEEQIGLIPITETIFSTFNIFIVVSLFITLPIFNRYISTKYIRFELSKDINLDKNEDDTLEPLPVDPTPSDRLENSKIISIIISVLGLAFVFLHFRNNGFDLNLNVVNFIMLFLGILFHGTPRKFLNSVTHAVKNVSGIIIQFPFYAGIMGMMVASGLSDNISLFFADISTEFTFPFFSFLSAGVLNFFIPSGGGQWAVQGPIMIPAGTALGVDIPKIAMSVAWGDAWTNMIQPFWTLPLLAIAGLKARDIMGICFMVLIFSAIPITIGLLFF
jgi:short-chain fatty acids transporter